ncbi:hypothetical protein D3C87_1380020 [compost metagenome]
MVRKTQIFLSDLKFDHLITFPKCTKEWIKGFTRLKIDRSIFDLNDHIISECTIEGYKFLIGLFGSIFRRRIINKGSPHNHTMV